MCRYVEVIEALLENKPAPDVNCNRYGWTLLMYAAKYERTEVMRVLLEKGAKVEKSDMQTCFRRVSWRLSS